MCWSLKEIMLSILNILTFSQLTMKSNSTEGLITNQATTATISMYFLTATLD